MDHVLHQGKRTNMDDLLSIDDFGRDDELSSAVGLRNALLLGAGLWAVILGGLFRFVI